MPRDGVESVINTWFGMRQRCSNPNNPQWKDYGGRGIAVRYSSLDEFFDDVGERPPGLTIERKDNDGDYAPGNVCWATRAEQQRNRRNAVFVEIEGEQYRLMDLAKQSGVNRETIAARARKGLSMAEVLSAERRPDLSGLALGGQAFAAKMRQQDHCGRGHKYTAENTLITAEGWRRCRECHNAKMRRRNAAKKAKRAAKIPEE